jgi:peptide/nickel transport system permease protein
MIQFLIRRILILIPLLFIISIIVFVIIQLPPGDFVTVQVAALKSAGQDVDEAEIAVLTKIYGLDKPIHIQYLRWIGKIIFEGDFGWSFTYWTYQEASVNDLLAERVPLTAAISILSAVFVWIVAVPIGIYSATHQYSLFDYFWTFVGFFGLAVPNFLLALIVLWIAFTQFDIAAIGLFSREFEDAPWTIAKIIDLAKHLWVPVVIVGTAGTAGLIRVMRGTLLDELNKQYVVTARAKGLKENKILFKYPVRVAINPIFSTIGWMLPSLVSGEVLVSMILNIPTTGPLLLGALISQDMFLAGSILLILSVLTVTGTLISDILLAWLDPRIRYD